MTIEQLLTANNQQRLTVIPAFVDTHLHLVEYGKYLSIPDLRHIKSIADLIAGLSDQSSRPIVHGFGWNQENFSEKRYPNRYDLDKIANDRPVLLSRLCGHITVVNSYTLAKLGIDQQAINVAGGQIDCDENGIPTGILREKARHLLYQSGFYDETVNNVMTYIKTAQADLLSKGIVQVHVEDCRAFPNLSWQQIIDAYLQLEKQGELVLDVTFQANVDDAKAVAAYSQAMQSDKVRIGSIKRFSDGSLGARTAHLRKPYSDDPNNTGIALQSEQQLQADFASAYSAGVPVVVHAIGDRAIERVLDAFASLSAPRSYLAKCGIIHCQISAPDLLARMTDLGIAAYIQPIFIHEDAKVVQARLGAKRAADAYAFRDMYDLAIPLYMGSDAPIETPDVVKGLYCATKRQTLDERPIKYLPHQALTLEEALEGYTSTVPNAWVELDMPIAEAVKTPHQNHIKSVWVGGEKVF